MHDREIVLVFLFLFCDAFTEKYIGENPSEIE